MSQRGSPDRQPEILLIEDDVQIRKFLRTTFSAENYQLREANTAAKGLSQAAEHPPDVIVIDLGLPDLDGVDLIRRVRQWNSTVHIIVLSVRSRERDKIKALDAGADDYVNKPFAVGELLARLRAVFRKSTPRDAATSSVFRAGDLEVNFATKRITVGGEEVHLTRIEYKLLEVLVRHVDKVVTHSQLLNEAWGPDHEDQIHYLRVYMLQLRRKIEADPTEPRYLRTESGIGYRLTTEAAQDR
jgi:two-component system, OmpR family, KDP operon response regulator KdpE